METQKIGRSKRNKEAAREMKVCLKCKEEKEEKDFYFYSNMCMTCHRTLAVSRIVKLKEEKIKYIRPERAKSKRARYFEIEEWHKFIACEDQPKFRLLWILIVAGGFRIRECLPMTKSMFNFEEGTVSVFPLKRKEPELIAVDIDPELLEEIKALPDEKLFPFKYHWAYLRFKEVARRAGLNPRYSPHTLRHLAGSLVYHTTGDLFKVKEALRHSAVAISEGYVHMGSTKRKETSKKLWKEAMEGVKIKKEET